MFETYEVPKLYIAVQAVLALYSTGRTTGAVIDSGDDVTHTVSVIEGIAIPHTVTKNNFAGRELNMFMSELLTKKGHIATEKEIVRDIKEKLCFVANDYELALKESVVFSDRS